MDCQKCQDQLLDYLYGEIEDHAADAVRAELDECIECRRVFEKLSVAQRLADFLPQQEPSALATNAILLAAREKVGVSTDSTAREVEAPEGLWAFLLRWMGSFAMGPQVAMATIMLLVVSIGLWYFPSEQRGPNATGGAVVNPDHGGEVAPSATLVPAEPLDLDLDPRTGRIVAREEDDGTRDRTSADQPAPVRQAQALALNENQPAAQPEVERAVRRQESIGGARARPAGEVLSSPLDEHANEALAIADGVAVGADDEDSIGEALPAEQSYGAAFDDQGARQAEGGAGGSLEVAQTRGPAVQMRAEAEQAPAAVAVAPPPAQPRPARTATASERVQRSPATTTAAGRATPGGGRAIYERGMSRYRGGDYWGASEDFTLAIRDAQGDRTLVPTALHHLARSHRRAGACQTALTHYRSLLSRFPTYSQAPRAMVEQADCYRRVGRLAEARRLLERAQRHTVVAADARRELMRVRQMERARVPSADVAAEEAAPAEATSY